MPFSGQVSEDILEDYIGRTAGWTPPTALYLGLSTAAPGWDGASAAEPSGGAYARIQITEAQWAAISGTPRSTSNNTDKAFATATADWSSGANMTHLVIYDAVTAGNFVGFKQLAVAKPVLNGDTAKFLSGQLTLSLGGTL